MLDLAVEFDALVTHRNPAQIVKRSNPDWSPDLKTIESKDCSVKTYGRRNLASRRHPQRPPPPQAFKQEADQFSSMQTS
jgi:hypothetical protein